MAERKHYDCLKCPGYCCSYPIIVVTKRDLARIARHFTISEAEAEERYCVARHGHKRILQRKPDTHFRRICRFFDTAARRCGYYDFLSFERDAQNDPDYVSTTRHAED